MNQMNHFNVETITSPIPVPPIFQSGAQTGKGNHSFLTHSHKLLVCYLSSAK